MITIEFYCRKWLLGCVALFMCAGAFSDEPSSERVLWDKQPIAFSVTVGKERLVHFPVEVRYWVPSSIEDSVAILAVNGVLYVTALREFEKTRIRVQSLVSNKVYLLDIAASENVTVTKNLIVMDHDHAENKAQAMKIEQTEQPVSDWFIRLTRFAAQSLYAKERLMPVDYEISSIRMDSTSSIPLVRGGDIEAIPMKSWRGGGYYVTAVRIRNLSRQDVVIMHEAPRVMRLMQRILVLSDDIRGDWIAVTPQHTTLEPSGHDDVTTLYLLSERSFTESF